MLCANLPLWRRVLPRILDFITQARPSIPHRILRQRGKAGLSYAKYSFRGGGAIKGAFGKTQICHWIWAIGESSTITKCNTQDSIMQRFFCRVVLTAGFLFSFLPG